MKKKHLLLAVALFFSFLSTITFTACDSDTMSYLDVKVVAAGTTTGISGANVTVRTEGGTIETRTGVTDANGIWQTSYAAPLVVKIKASLDGKDSPEYTVRLKESSVTEAIAYL